MFSPIIIQNLFKPVRFLIALTVIGGLCSLGSSCSTVHGFGHDVENAGEAIEDAAY